MHDLVIRNGFVVDGTGAPGRAADVAIDDGSVTAVTAAGEAGAARRVLDASGLLVTPGWVDAHTHYDAQVSWDPWLTPSSWHGVTTVVMGNCGVGFAPVAPDRHEWLIELMEGSRTSRARRWPTGSRGRGPRSRSTSTPSAIRRG
ncbi:MAG: amidohydrolase family protein [Ilumatobacteraceae bacterium]